MNQKNLNLLYLLLFLLPIMSFSQTAGTLTFSFTPLSHTSDFGDEHVLAVWIQSNTGGFVKTKIRRAGNGTKDHLKVWAVNSGGTSSNCLGTACNVTDATTGATLTSYTSKTIVWDGKNVSGSSNGTTVADGTYKVTIELTWDDGSSNTVTRSFSFTKGPNIDFQTPASDSDFSAITLNWVPTVLANEELQNNQESLVIYPNPSEGVFNVIAPENYSKIVVFNELGQEVFTQAINQNDSESIPVDLTNFENGLYILKAYNGSDSIDTEIVLKK
jgi:hypothetical protein